MKLQFTCQSHACVTEQARQHLFDQVGEWVKEVESAEPGRLAICFEVCGTADDSMPRVVQILDALGDVSTRFQVTWSVGHQHEAHLGCVREGEWEAGLREDILTSLQVARTFGGMIVDDEFIDPEFNDVGPFDRNRPVSSATDEANWHEVLSAPDDFTPFPEWDDDAAEAIEPEPVQRQLDEDGTRESF
ncbi:MAG: hypothetical protein AAFX06_22635 [Planctomycetota bacterium]